MKKVLITGANSYIGSSFESWVRATNKQTRTSQKTDCQTDSQGGRQSEIHTDTVDMRDGTWRQKDFGGYDAVFHVAGIAHADVGKATEEEKRQYYEVNTELTAECAQKAKNEGVRQFIFMSSIIVYGESAGIGRRKVITAETKPAPANFYGDSKLQAEERLLALQDEAFRVVILRPPMIYGRGSRGNYPLLAGMATGLPLFPKEKNERSMLYIGNLCKFVELMIQNEEQGIFYPQNRDYVCTSDMVKAIAAEHGRKIHLTGLFHPILLLFGRIGGKFGELTDKAFGNLVYDQALSRYREEYRIYDLEESIRLTEGEHND